MTEDAAAPLIHDISSTSTQVVDHEARFARWLDQADEARRQHRHHDAVAMLRALRRAATVEGRDDVVGRSLLVLAYVHLESGRPRSALRAVNTSERYLSPDDPDVLVTRATLLWRTDRLHESVACFSQARQFIDQAPLLVQFRCFNNWFGALWELGDLDEARNCLTEAEHIAQSLTPAEQLIVAHNRGNLAAASGELTSALRHWVRAEQLVREHEPSVLLETYVDRLTALLDLGLHEEALELAEQTRVAAIDHPDRLLAGEATLRCSEAALASRSFARARTHAIEAERLFGQLRQPGRQLWARALAARSLAGGGQQLSVAIDELTKVIAAMRRNGQHRPLQEMHLALAQLARTAERTRLSRYHFAQARALGLRANPLEQLRGAVADVYLAHDDDNMAGIRDAVDRSLAALDHFRSGLMGLELRSRAGSLTAEVIELAMARELADGDRWRCWRYAEHARARSLTTTPMAQHVPVLSLTSLQRALSPWQIVVSLLDVAGELHVAIIRHDDITWCQGPSTITLLRAFKDALRALRRDEFEPERAQVDFHDARTRIGELLAPITDHLDGSNDVIIVPPAVLLSMPWMAVPEFELRSVVVVPSASLWASLSEAKRPDRVACIGGPGLANVERELHTIARSWRLAAVTVDGHASVASALTMLSSNDLVHFAGHGVFRHDNPMFSGLLLSDGSLTARDVDRLGVAPPMVVLSACSVGQSAPQPGDETLGLMTTLLANGTSVAVVSLVPLPDGAAATAMGRLHARLAGGQHASQALMVLRTMDDLALSVRFGLTCFGRD
jgi:tetratricopeptide (TPR) repeat protein